MERKLESVCSIQTDFINCICKLYLSYLFFCILFSFHFAVLLFFLKTQNRRKPSISNQIKVKLKLEGAFTGKSVTFPKYEYHLL